MYRRKTKAFTLVEILIAACVLAMFMIAVTKMWSKMNTNATRGMWKSGKEKELRHASKMLQDYISAATLPSIIVPGNTSSATPGGAFFVDGSGNRIMKGGATNIPLDFMITYEHDDMPTTTPFLDHTDGSLSNVYLAIFGTNGFETAQFDGPIGFENESINELASGSTAVNLHEKRTPLSGAIKVLHWVEAKPVILGDAGTLIWNTLELQPGTRGTYKLVHRRYGSNRNMASNSGSATIPSRGSGTVRKLIDSVVRMEIAAYPLPNDPRLSDCSADDDNQFLQVSPGSGATIALARSYSSGVNAPFGPDYAANHISEANAELDIRRSFMLYIKIACAMKGQPSPQNRLYSAESMQIKTNLFVMPKSNIGGIY